MGAKDEVFWTGAFYELFAICGELLLITFTVS